MTSWSYNCKLGFNQSTCRTYEMDKRARGYAQGFGGCASCKHRVPANPETELADLEFQKRRCES